MKIKKQIFLFLAILFAGAGFMAAGSSYPVTAEGVALQTPVPFSPCSPIGLDAVSCLYPAGAKPGSEEFEITFVFFSTQMQSDTGFSDREMHDYARSTFLGLGMPAKENKTRMFAGKEVKGDVNATSIPRPAFCESYLLFLADGRKLVLAFKAFASMDKALAETIVAAAAASFAEKK